MKKLLVLYIIFLMTGCATIKDVATSPKTFAVCKAADIATTAIALKSSAFVEGNSIVAATLTHGYFPLIAISYGLYELIKYFDDPVSTAGANAITCGTVVNNTLLLLK